MVEKALNEEKDLLEELKTNRSYRRTFAGQLVAGAAVVGLHEWHASPGMACVSLDIVGAGCLEYVIDGWMKWAVIAVGATPASVFIVDTAKTVIERGRIAMGILFKPVRNKYVAQGVEQGRAEGRAEGEARGRAEGEARGRAEGEARGAERGRAELVSEISEWQERMERARREGREFSEPPPWEFLNGKGE